LVFKIQSLLDQAAKLPVALSFPKPKGATKKPFGFFGSTGSFAASSPKLCFGFLAKPGSPKQCIQNPKGVLERVIPKPSGPFQNPCYQKAFGFLAEQPKGLFFQNPFGVLEKTKGLTLSFQKPFGFFEQPKGFLDPKVWAGLSAQPLKKKPKGFF